MMCIELYIVTCSIYIQNQFLDVCTVCDVIMLTVVHDSDLELPQRYIITVYNAIPSDFFKINTYHNIILVNY